MLQNYIKRLHNIDNSAFDAVVELFNLKGIKELDISNSNDEYDDVKAYCYDDDCHCATNIKLNRIVLENGNLTFIDEYGSPHCVTDFHIGTMPYIHNMVKWITSDMPDIIQPKKYNVHLYYHGCFSTTVEAKTEEEALDLAQQEIDALSDLEFLDAIELQSNGNDVSEKRGA
jgi:hypothetical protein